MNELVGKLVRIRKTGDVGYVVRVEGQRVTVALGRDEVAFQRSELERM